MLSNGFYDKLLAENRIREEDKEPEIECFRFYIEAFSELSTCRPSGMSLGPIPFSSIVEYHRVYELEEELDDFLWLMRAMDSKLMELERKKDGPANSNKGNKGKSGRTKS